MRLHLRDQVEEGDGVHRPGSEGDQIAVFQGAQAREERQRAPG